ASAATNDRTQCGCRHASGSSNAGRSEGSDVTEVREYIDCDQGCGTDKKRNRKDSLWINCLTRRVGHILPALIGPEYADHRQSKPDNSRCSMNQRICIAKDRVCATRQENNAQNQNSADLECRGYIQ